VPDLAWYQANYCTLTFTVLVNGSSNINAALFSFNSATGVFTINSDDPSVNGQTFEVKLKVSDNAGNSNITTIQVKFIDPCAGSQILSLPTFVTPLLHSIYGTDKVIVNDAVAT
jgi:hypothetical protein